MRAPDADELLRRLARGVRPIGAVAASRAAGDGPDFTSLLTAARSGALASGRRVEIPAGFGVELTPDEHDDLDHAADAADASGALTIAAIVDGAALIVDIPSRRATDARALRDAQDGPVTLIDSIDAVAVLTRAADAEAGDDAPARTMAPDLREPPATRIANASLLRSLADASSPGAQSGE